MPEEKAKLQWSAIDDLSTWIPFTNFTTFSSPVLIDEPSSNVAAKL
jgi:hypothetical protein